MERLKDYRDFLKRFGYDHLLEDPDRLIYKARRTIAGADVAIAGLNSSWSCCREEEKAKLWLGGDWQLGHLTETTKDAALKLALIHHPVNWFIGYEDSILWRQIERDFTFCLHGHEHKDWVTPVDGHTRIAAAACYDRSNRENGYNFVRINLDTGKGEIWLRRFESDGGGWIPRIVKNKTNDAGVWPLAVVRGLPLPAAPQNP
jgi:hypothetical protein